MADYPDFFQEHRLEKRQRLLDAGVNPFPYSYTPTHTLAELEGSFADLESSGEEARVAGRILSVRKMGKSWFLDLIDRGTQFQMYVRRGEATDSAVELVPNIDIGDWLGVTGPVFTTRTGQPTMLVKDMMVLGKSVADVPYGKIHDGTSSYTLSNMEIRRQQRYLDWITDPESVDRFELRARIISAVRRTMESWGFIEVDTPTLEMVYGGAEARPFTTSVWA